MAATYNYATGPMNHFFKQLSGLQQFRKKYQDRFRELTNREIEVLTLIAEGKNNQLIAGEFDIARTTVQNHRAQIREKLNITNQVDFVKFALANELIEF